MPEKSELTALTPDNVAARVTIKDDNLEASAAAREWFGDTFFSAYLQFKRAELGALKGLVPAQICERYAAVY